MKRHTILSLIIFGMLSTVGPASAEVRMSQERLSIKANAIPIQTLLEDLSRQGAIRVTVLEKASLKDVTISEQFEGLPIAEGLSRLFAHWNYGLTRNTETGHIQEIFLASKRAKPDELPSTLQTSLTSHDQERSSDESQYRETLAISFQEEERQE